jgi:hypothetical protein
VHPFDWLLLRRSTLAAAVVAALTAGIVVSTDEAASTAAMRVARMAAFAPLVAAVAALSVVAHARSRGELRALECLGVPPWRAAHGAAQGALLVAATGIAVLISPWADAASLFPVVRSAVDWTMDATGLLASALGVAVSGSGKITLTSALSMRPHVLPQAWAALPCFVPLAAVVPSWAVTPMSSSRRASSVGVTGLVAVVCLHFVAAGRFNPFISVAAVIPLLAATLRARS